MIATRSLVDELQAAIAGSDIGRRAEMLRRVADLFALTSVNLSHEQIALFDDVMDQLIDEIEMSARIRFAEYLANGPAAPPGSCVSSRSTMSSTLPAPCFRARSNWTR